MNDRSRKPTHAGDARLPAFRAQREGNRPSRPVLIEVHLNRKVLYHDLFSSRFELLGHQRRRAEEGIRIPATPSGIVSKSWGSAGVGGPNSAAVRCRHSLSNGNHRANGNLLKLKVIEIELNCELRKFVNFATTRWEREGRFLVAGC